MRSAVDYLESLSPWPQDGFGLDRIVALLAELGDPQRAYPSIHVVGTNGKGTTTRTIEETLAGEGLLAGGYYSPHVTGWAERIRVTVRKPISNARSSVSDEPAERLGATQFEVLTAAALAEFAEAGVDVAAVEAGLGGRFDATNVLDAPVVVLTNVALEHTDVLGDTREQIAAEKLAVVRPGATVVLGEAGVGGACARERRRRGRRRNGRQRRARRRRRIGVPRAARRAGSRPAAGPARVARRRALGRCAHARGRAVPRAAPSAARRDRRVDPLRQGRRGNAAAPVQPMRPLSSRRRPAMHGRFPPRSSPPSRSRSSRTSRRSRIRFAPCERARELGTPVLVTGSLYLLADLAVRSTRVA